MKLNPTFPPGRLDVPTRQAERSIYQILAESGVPGHSLHNRGAHMAEPASLHPLMAPRGPAPVPGPPNGPAHDYRWIELDLNSNSTAVLIAPIIHWSKLGWPVQSIWHTQFMGSVPVHGPGHPAGPLRRGSRTVPARNPRRGPAGAAGPGARRELLPGRTDASPFPAARCRAPWGPGWTRR